MTDTKTTMAPEAVRLETLLRIRLRGRVRNLRVLIQNDGVILQGTARTYYAKQIAQHAVMQETSRPILANEIAVFE